MNRAILLCATCGGLGNIPFASGTWGTLAGIPLFWALARLSPVAAAAVGGIFVIAACWIADRAGRLYHCADDGRIVIDEVAGYLVAVAGEPFSWTTALAAFFLFRLFDIVKVPPASWVDRNCKHGVGVVVDDLIAGLYALGALQLLRWLSVL